MSNLKNPYPGVNPHLNSLLQTPGEAGSTSLYPVFHVSLIPQIMIYLNQRLPENYIAVAEESLQLVALDDPTSLRKLRPDVSVFQSSSLKASYSAAESVATPTWEITLEDTLDPVDTMKAIWIHQVENARLGAAVACIEVLSPANKPGGAHYPAYRRKRMEYLYTGIPLLEIDLLHESSPIIPWLPVYPVDPDAKPFYIAVSDPRPEYDRARIYGFSVGEVIPTIPIPLAESEYVIADFDAIYQQTFEQSRFDKLCNYHYLPERFERYSAADQTLIRQYMAEIIN